MTRAVLLLIALAGLHATSFAESDSGEIEELRVVGRRVPGFSTSHIDADRLTRAVRDVAALASRVPGGGTNDNGPVAGQVQYRGMFGPRLNVLVDGMHINSGGPNWMDPPLHYVPPALLDSLTIQRGVASVSTGGGIGGAAAARWRRPDFASDARWQVRGEAEAAGRTDESGYGIGGLIGGANDTHRVYLLASRESGEDYDFGNGTVDGTEYRRDAYALGYGLASGGHRVDVDLRRIDTDNSGTPSLPLDIGFFETNLWSVVYGTELGQNALGLKVYGSHIDHRMDNFKLRPPPDFSNLPLPPFQGDERRYVNSDSTGIGYLLTLARMVGGGDFVAGVDGHFAEHQATVFDPDFAPFFVQNFNNVQRDYISAFAEWSTELTDGWFVEAGIRGERVDMDAGDVDAFPARLVDMDPAMWPPGTPPRAVWVLRERFNSSDRDLDDFNVDWVLRTRVDVNPELTAEIAIARKTRAPNYQERFLWIPLEVNAGLGDGNNYVGNLDLDSEISHQIEVGIDWRMERVYVAPRAYYRRIDDYIQGVASTDPIVIAVSANANGDPTPLAFDNVDAKIYGFDVGFGAGLTDRLKLDATATWVRGERRDVDDNLYRVTPPNLRLGLTWEQRTFNVTLEQVLVARQDRLSKTLTLDPGNPSNAFEETSAHAVTNVFAGVGIGDHVKLAAGIENLWDKNYIDYLTGFNRVTDGEVAVGGRLPGRGRNFYARLRYRW